MAHAIEALDARHLLAGNPIITEFMASNQSTLLDGYGVASDWIEIMNAGDTPVNLNGWHLTDNPADLTKWTFPSKALGVGEYLIVFASDADSTVADPDGYLHAGFKLSAEGEYLALTNPASAIVSEFGTATTDFPGQLDDISYGLAMHPLVTATIGDDGSTAGATLIGHWKLDEPSSSNPTSPGTVQAGWDTTPDASTANITGIYQDSVGNGAVVGVAGARPDTSTAADFDGVNQEVFLGSPNIYKLANQFTISAWINPDVTTAGRTQRVFSQAGGGYGFGIIGDEFKFTTYGIKDYQSAAANIPAGVWSHIAVVFDAGNDATFYLNGNLVETVAGDAAANIAGTNFFLASTGTGERFGGLLDDVRIYNGTLTNDEIRATIGLPPAVLTPYGQWPLDETSNPSSGKPADDISPTNLNGVYQPTGGVGGPIVGGAGATIDTGTSAHFNGTTDNISLGASSQLRLTSNFTLTAWIKPDATPANVVQRIFSQTPGGGYGFGLNGSELRFTTYGRKDYETSTGDETTISPGIWTHVAVVFDGAFDASFYVNGEFVETVAGDLAAAVGTNGFFIGSTGAATGNEAFAGSLDDIRLYNRTLTATQIATLAGQTPTSNADASYFVPTDGSVDATWKSPAFDDSAWHGATLGIGVEGAGNEFDGLIQTELPSVANSVYVRTSFNVDDPAGWNKMFLRMMYDDGFVAYLNGVEIARANAPAAVAWNSAALAPRTNADATTFDGFDVSAFTSSLVAGENILAIQMLNAGDDDMLALPELTAFNSTLPAKFISTPTPGAPNSADGFVDVVEDTQFSVDRGFFNAPFSLEITTPTAGATIVYTTNGSTPTVNALGAVTNGTTYSGPINVSSTRTIRAAAFKTGYRPTNIDTQTYIFLAGVVTQSPTGAAPAGWPSAPINTQIFDYGMDPDIVNSALYGPQLPAALTSIPTLSLVTDLSNLFDPAKGIYVNADQRGSAWERPASLELINPDGSQGFQADAGLRIRGGFSRGHFNPKHSFRLFFDDAIGPEKLNFPLFGDEGDDTFDKIDLRTAQNYAWSNDTFNDASRNTFLRDEFSRDVMREMGQPYAKSNYYHLYINGQYWGLYETEERPEKHFAESYLGGDDDDYDVMSNRGLVDGSITAWNQTWALATTGFASDAAYYAIQGKNPDGTDNLSLPVYVDVDNLIDYMTTIFYTGNFDGPVAGGGRNNFYAIRSRVSRDGWQFIAHDSEHSMMSVTEDRTGPFGVGAVLDQFNPQWLHERLSQNAEYRLKFADRIHEYMFNGGLLTPGSAAALMQQRANEISTAIIGESARWGDEHEPIPYTQASWQTEVNWLMNTYFPQRTATVLNQLKADGLYPNVAAPSFNQNGGPISEGFSLSITAPASQTFTDTTLLAPTAPVKAFVPTAAFNTSFGTTWKGDPLVPFSDVSWLSAAGPVGYDRTGANFPAGTVGLNLLTAGTAAQRIDTNGDGTNENNSVYIRYTFNTAAGFNAANYERLLMRVKYDDAFIAYLNGQEIARSTLLPATITWNSAATAARTQTLVLQNEEFNVTSFLSALVAGPNVLSFQLLNVNATSSDLLLAPELVLGDLQTGASNPIYYTLDGSDPRLPGGAISPAAVLYTSPVTLNSSTTVNARAYLSGSWSALNDSVFSVASPIRVSEIMYQPREATGAESFANRDEYEFIELMNTSATATVDLEGYELIDGITFTFGDLSLAPGQRVVVASNAAAFAERYGNAITIAGEYDGNLSNGGEQIQLVGAQGEEIQTFTYDDAWYPETDGDGYSLIIVDPLGSLPAWSTAAGWKASLAIDGSPGSGDSLIGDVNGDASVNLLDLAILQAHFGMVSGATPADGDLTGDSAVNRADAGLLAKNFGRSLSVPGPSPSAAPSALAIVRRRAADEAITSATQTASVVLVARRRPLPHNSSLAQSAADQVFSQVFSGELAAGSVARALSADSSAASRVRRS